MKKILIFPLLALGSTVYGQPIFGGTVQFYFSAAGGDDSRISEDPVTSSAWTNEYDVLVKNVSGHDITFNYAGVLIGYGQTTSFGQSATPTPGTDTIRERNAFSGNRSFANNLNITWVPAWVSAFGTGTRMFGGYDQPLSGPSRPWGFYAEIFNTTVTQTIANGQVLPLFRIALRDNGLFQQQGMNNLQLYNYPMNGGSTTLIRYGTDWTYSYDNQNYFQNSRLTLVAPEPGIWILLIAGVARLASKRRDK